MAANNPVSLLSAAKKLLEILKFDRKDISAIYFFALLGGLISLSLPLGIQYIISFVQANQISASIIVLIALVLTGVFLNGFIQIRLMQVIEKIEQKLFVRYSLEFADRLPKLDIEKLDGYYLPELTNRYFDSVSLIKGIEKLLLDIPAAVIQIAFGLILLALYHPVFIAFGALLLIVLVIIIRATSPKGFATSLKASDYKYSIAAWLQEIATSIKTFKYAKTTSLHIKKADEELSGYLASRTSHFKILLAQYWSFVSFKIIITAAMLIVGCILLVNQQINIGQFIAADIVILTIIGSVEKMIASLDKVYDALTSVEKLSKITHAAVEEDGNINLPIVSNGVSIEMKDVNFTYANGVAGLRNVNLHIKSGAFVCVYGASGSGKSSFLRLLTGAFKNYTGNVFVEGLPISNYSLSSLRSQTGILFGRQDVFKGTLLENITMGNEVISIDEVYALADTLGLKNYFQTLKDGLHTLVDPDGKRLPQKIKKDILLMRALIGKHRLLLLENAFEHLSPKQVEMLVDFLRNDKNATVIITTENIPLSAHFDMLITLNDGTIQSIQ